MLKLETRYNLEALHTGGIKEGLNLEYKASDAVDGSDRQKIEMARDVCAFANADGGQIVYGMTENNHEPAGLDAGIDRNRFPSLWFEQVLQQHVVPHIKGLRIIEIPLERDNVAVVIEIPAATGDPHQASDNKYYRRHNFNRLAMEHYEVREAFRRVTQAEPLLKFVFVGDRPDIAEVREQNGRRTAPVMMFVKIGNRSNQPAFHTLVRLFLDAALNVSHASVFRQTGSEPAPHNNRFNIYSAVVTTPPNLPVFKELEFNVNETAFYFDIPADCLDRDTLFQFGYEVTTPGYIRKELGSMMLRKRRLSLEIMQG